MHPMRRIEEIKSTLEDGEEGAAEIRAAARLLEVAVPLGNVLSAVAADEFRAALIGCSEGRPSSEARAWLTLAAAGSKRARLTLAWRASEVLRATDVAEVYMSHRGNLKEECRRRAGRAGDGDVAGAWMLLAWLTVSDLRRLVRARPTLASSLHRARASRRGLTRALVSPAPGSAAVSGIPSFG